MTRLSRRITALLTLALLAALTGCGLDTPFTRPPAMTNGVAVVVGSSANEPRLTAAQWEAVLAEDVGDGTTLTLVSADGEPSVLATWQVELPQNAADAREELAAQVTRLAQGAAATSATSAEVDPWGSLAAARRALGGVDSCRLVSSSSFLSTVLPVDLPRLGLGVEPADLATQLAEAGALPDLSGCTVVLLALGESAGTQPVLDERARTMLSGLVVTLLERAGATVDASRTLRGEAPADGLPSVTPVPVEMFAPTAAVAGSSSGPGPGPGGNDDADPCRSEIPEAAVGFLANEAAFLDREASAGTIAAAAEALRGCDLGSVTVYATTSSAGEAADRLTLSEERGRALAGPLAAALGIDPAGIAVVGLGACESPEAATSPVTCVDDRPGGVLDLDLAQLNRRAVVVAGQ